MKLVKANWPRKLIQFIVLIIIIIFSLKLFTRNFNPETYCPLGGLQAISTYFVQGNLACDITTVQVALGLLLGLAILLFGKLFCSYLCPLGYISELLVKFRKSSQIKEIVIRQNSIIDKILRSIKYILLFLIFYFSISYSELFCKLFDPYYAAATGFKGEINGWMALIAIYLLLIGGVFIKMFWCKYICPLGAISNIFKYFITAIIITVLYFLLHLIGWTLPWEWLLIIFCITGYLNEIFHNRPKIFPLFKITRDTTKCTGCGDCMKKCPYNIPVHLTRTVKNVDCTLCGDCISECKSAALSINKKKNIKWIIPIITILFFATGILIGNKWEIPVINYTWGNRDTIKTKILEIDGLRSVSCYYAAINFSKKIRKIKGTYGIKAYTRNKRVIITYNPDETAPEIIRKSLYRPVKLKIFKPDKSVRRIKVLTLHTANMEDPLDVSYLGLQFRTIKRKYYALSSEYSNPLTLKLYIDINEPIDLDFIKNIVETPELSIPLRGGRIRKIKMGFKFLYLENKIDTISKRSMLELMFRPYKKIFKKDLDQKDLETYEIIYPNIEKPILRRYLPYLANYLSQNKWIWGIETTLNNDCSSVIRIYYSRTHFNKQAIQNMLTHEKWRIKINDSTFKEIHAALPFHFKEKHK